MAKDNTVAGLYLRIGLNYDELNQDFVRIEETIKSNVQRLGRESTLISLKAAIDLTGVTDPAQRLKIEQEKLTRLIEIQTQKVKMYESAWIDAGKSNGYASQQAQSAAIALKQQELALARLSQRLKEVTQEQNQLSKAQTDKSNFENSLLGKYTNIKGNVSEHLNNIASAFSGIKDATSSADAAISKSLEIIGSIPSPVGKAVAALASIPLVAKGVENSLLDMAKPAIAAGDALYVLSRGMQLSIADAAKLNMICKVTGIEINEVNSSMRRLSAQLNKAGEKDTGAKKMLAKFGANVFDSAGQVKNEIELIDELSKALLRAEAAGQGAAFRDIVGGKFWSGDFITFLEDYAGNVELASKVVKNGLANPALAHEVQGNLNAMNAQIGQFKSAVSAAFLPATQYIVPELTAQFGELTRVIAQNADGIKNISMSIGEFVVGVSKVTTEITKLAAESTKLFATPTSAIVDKYKGDKDIQNANDLKNKILADAKTERDRIRALTTPDDYYEKDFQALSAARRQDYLKRIEQAQNKIQAAEEKFNAAIREEIAQNEILTEESLKRIQDYAAELEKINIGIEFHNSGYEQSIAELELWREKALELADGNLDEQISVMELYVAKVQQIELDKEDKLNEIREQAAQSQRTDLENTLANIEKEKESWINAGMEEVEATELAQQQKFDAIKQLNDEFSEHINSLYQTQLENRLAQIEKEKQAWIQKGIDEVKATKAAEEQKVQAQRNAAMSLLKSSLKEYRAFQEGGYEGLRDYQLRQLYKSGIRPEDLQMTPQQLANFQKAQQIAQNSLLPNFMTGADKYNNNLLRQAQAQQEAMQRDALAQQKLNLALGDAGQNLNLDDFLKSILDNVHIQDFDDNITVDLTEALQNVKTGFDNFDSNIGDISNRLSDLSQPLNEVTEYLSIFSERVQDVTESLNEVNVSEKQPVNVNVTVQINEATAWDSEHIQQLADKVADQVEPAIVNAIGGDSNSY